MKRKKDTKFVILAGLVLIVIVAVGLLYVADVNVVEVVTSVVTGNPFEITEVTAEIMPGSVHYSVFIHVKNNGGDTYLVEDTTIKIDGELVSSYLWSSESYWLEPGQTAIYEVSNVHIDECIDIEWALDGHILYHTYCL